ncbi:hypothetical protein AVEN_185562-1 [Araneus ventricosus]|uniref:Uncharacterized protein n=1 Tax=Araneus ventricosus TaxID=182803 RepID=A0A4Y2HD14_ARAVE|nr:hypothetical protein AVEN_185562-1 [Araneus ventricosus]
MDFIWQQLNSVVFKTSIEVPVELPEIRVSSITSQSYDHKFNYTLHIYSLIQKYLEKTKEYLRHTETSKLRRSRTWVEHVKEIAMGSSLSVNLLKEKIIPDEKYSHGKKVSIQHNSAILRRILKQKVLFYKN